MLSCRKALLNVFRPGIQAVCQKHTLPDLPYEYNALEPAIHRDIMNIHHCKHHQAYVDNLNKAEDQLKDAIEKNDICKIIQLQPALRFNGGGHINHSIFWQCLTPSETKPSCPLQRVIKDTFGTIDNCKKQLAIVSIGIQGSGWGWLACDRKSKKLTLVAMPNQDPLEPTTGLVPLAGIDVWEHAYYLQYKNNRAAYVEGAVELINWDYVSEIYDSIEGSTSCG